MIDCPTLATVEAWLVPLPLRRPVQFAATTWTTWNYVVIRVRDVDGRVGSAYAFKGEVPLDLMVTELVGPAVVGRQLGDLRSVSERCAQLAGPPMCDVVRPAASLVEVCLWDIAGQSRSLPLWAVLQPQPVRSSVSVMLVEHRRDGDTATAFAERVATLVDDGIEIVKIKYYGDGKVTAAVLAAIRSAAGERLDIVVDVGWAWTTLDQAIGDANLWAEHRLAWIEDPFPPYRIRETARLREATGVPVGVGDAITSIDLAERLIEDGAVDILRVDVTTLGGVAGLERLAEIARPARVELSPELCAEVHQHMAFALPEVRGVEMYTKGSGVWSGDALIRPGALRFERGNLIPPDRPGSGLDVDWDATRQHAVRYSRFPV